MKRYVQGMGGLFALLVVTGCQTTEDESTPVLSPEQVTAIQTTWTGTWSGAWTAKGDCPSSITVSDVQGTTARAVYTWGAGCGGMRGSHTDSSAKIKGDTLMVYLTWGNSAEYTMRDDGNLDGVWRSKRLGKSVPATFFKQ